MGRAKLGGIPMGVIAVETRAPADGERGKGCGGLVPAASMNNSGAVRQHGPPDPGGPR